LTAHDAAAAFDNASGAALAFDKIDQSHLK
jgi:hypothetical protein